MAPNLLGSLAQYDTPPLAQGNTPIPNSQHGGADKGPQTQKRKRAGSKLDKEQPIAPQKNVQNQKKAKMTQKEQANHCEDPSPANQEKRGQTPLPLQNAAAGTKTPQPYSLPDIASRNSPPLPPSPIEEAQLRKRVLPALLRFFLPCPTIRRYIGLLSSLSPPSSHRASVLLRSYLADAIPSCHLPSCTIYI